MKKKEILVFLAIFLTAIISTVSFIAPHYSVDTIEFLTNGYKDYVNFKYIADGRIFSAILLKLTINFNMKYVISIYYIIGIIISCITVMYLKKLVKRNGYKNENETNIIPIIICYVTIFNFMYTDVLRFFEFPIIAISLLLYIIAANLIIEKQQILKPLVITMIAMFCYQGTVTILVMIVLLLLILKENDIKKNFLDIIKTCLIVLIPLAVNLLFITLIGKSSRISTDVIGNIGTTIKNIILIIFNSAYQYPEYLQLIFLILICIWCVANKIKILKVIMIYLCSMMISSALLLTSYNQLITVPEGRILLAVGSAIGLIFMYLYCKEGKARSSKVFKTLVYLYFVSILIIYMIYTFFYMKGQNIDKTIVNTLNEQICEYEEETGNQVSKYVVNSGENYIMHEFIEKKYGGLIIKYIEQGCNIGKLLFSPTFFEIYADRTLEKINVEDEEFYKLFENKDLTSFQDRIIIENDTIYFIL